MRRLFAITAVLALAACDSGSVPPPGQEPLRASKPQVAENEVVLRAEGLVAGPEAFYFSAGKNEVEAALTAALGEPVERSENAECGIGPMEFTEYPGKARQVSATGHRGPGAVHMPPPRSVSGTF